MLLSFLFLYQLWHCATYTVCWLLSLCRFFSLFTVDKPVDCFFYYALPCPHCGMSLLLLLSCCTATAITNKSTATPPESQLILAFLLAFVPLSSMLPFPRPFDCYCIFWTTPHQCGAISLLLLSCFTAKAAPQQPHCTLQTASWFSPFCQLSPLSPPLPLLSPLALQQQLLKMLLPLYCNAVATSAPCLCFVACAIAQSVHYHIQCQWSLQQTFLCGIAVDLVLDS